MPNSFLLCRGGKGITGSVVSTGVILVVTQSFSQDRKELESLDVIKDAITGQGDEEVLVYRVSKRVDICLDSKRIKDLIALRLHRISIV